MASFTRLAILFATAVTLVLPVEALAQQSNKSSVMLRGRVTKVQPAPAPAPAPSQMAVSQAPGAMVLTGSHGMVLTGALGEQTTMLPADFVFQTGFLSPARPNYTPAYRASTQARMNGKQWMGPMSVVHFSASKLKSSVIATSDVLIWGIPLRTSGAMTMERPGYSPQQLARARAWRARQQLAATSREPGM